MRALFYDCETSGLPLFNEPSEDPRQPHIVQLGALLVDLDTRKTLASIDVTIEPQGWVIPDDVAKIHGITTDYAMQIGVCESHALELFIQLWQSADLRVGHNEQFDARIVKIALHRSQVMGYGCEPDVWKKGRAECTQILATPILKLPPTQKMLDAGRRHHKSANLREAYRHFMGQDLVDAHSAIADATGCMHVYFAIKSNARAA